MRVDDDGLLQALHEGVFETPLWHDFLVRLLGKTGAGLIVLMLRPGDAEGAIVRSAGSASASGAPAAFTPDAIADAFAIGSMRQGRVYALEDLLEPTHRDRDQIPILPGELGAMRSIRVTEPGGVDLWLAFFGGKRIGPATAALLTALAPHLRIALRHFAERERERFRSAVTGQAFDRLNMGWLSLGAGCRIIDTTENVEQMFALGTLLRRGRYDRLTPVSPAIDRRLTALLKDFSAQRDARPQAINLSKDPWVEMLVTPVQGNVFPGSNAPLAIVYLSGDRRSQAARCDQLVDLFGLLPSEARLAWMLAQATSIAAAAEALGLTIETARNYSKKIYAKTGARGQAELVRIILTRVLAIS